MQYYFNANSFNMENVLFDDLYFDSDMIWDGYSFSGNY